MSKQHADSQSGGGQATGSTMSSVSDASSPEFLVDCYSENDSYKKYLEGVGSPSADKSCGCE